jgi:N-acetylglucosaminyldiphosphoundecaprenol N-acetyl-beta-D-mannosaminyltransferase
MIAVSRDEEHDAARARSTVLGVGVDGTSCDDASEVICGWAAAGASRMVFAANVHMTMEAFDDPAFRTVMDRADLVVADGQPLVWALRADGCPGAQHARGQDLVLSVCAMAERRGLATGLYGTTDEVLDAAKERLLGSFPRLDIVYACAPPFRALDAEEDQRVVDEINASGARILFVSLGCPKQEKWMAAHLGRVRAVMIGAGAAVDMIGGQQPVAPLWMQSHGLEWLFRLASDPRRLWRRYAQHNLRFAALVAADRAATRLRSRSSRP